MSINSPENKTYVSNAPISLQINMGISTNGTNPKVYWNIWQNGLWRLDNLSYPEHDLLTIVNNGTYLFFAWVLVDEGSLVNQVEFSTSIITESIVGTTTQTEDLTPLIFALILILLNMIALLAKQPILCFVFAIFTISIAGIYLISDINMPYNPFSTIMVVFVAIVCMLLGVFESKTKEGGDK